MGARGPAGIQGPAGDRGPKGEKGDKGDSPSSEDIQNAISEKWGEPKNGHLGDPGAPQSPQWLISLLS